MRRNHFLFASTFFMSLAISMFVFSLVFLLADRFEMKSGTIGLFLALGYGSYLAGCTLYHRIGRFLAPGIIIPLAALIMGIFCLLLWKTYTPGAAAVFYGIIQGSTGFFWPPLMGWFTQGLAGKELNRDMGWFNLSWTGGGLLAPFAAGTFYKYSPRLDFQVILSAFFLVALLQGTGLFLVPGMGRIKKKAKPDDKKPAPNLPSGAAKPAGPSLPPRGLLLRFPSWVGLFCAYVFLGVAINILPLEIRDGLGYSEQAAGTMLLLRGVASLAGFALLSRVLFWHFNSRWILIIQGVFILLPLLFILARGSLPLYGLLLGGFGLVFSGAYNNSLFHSSAGAVNSSRRMAIHEGFLTAGVAFGSFGGGLAHQHFGFTGTLVFLSLVQAAGFLIMLLIIGKIDYYGKKTKAAAG